MLLYPSCVVNFRLRFDEAFQVADIPDPGPQSGDPEATAVPANPALRPLITQTGENNLSFVMNRVPRSASVELPGYRQAGKFMLEFDWRELPIDPRLLRSTGVEIFMGTVSPENFATGMTSVDRDGRRRSVLSTVDEFGSPRDDLMVLAGVVDNWFTQHGDGGSITRVEGRDLRGIFLDSPCNPAVLAKLDLTRPVTSVVQDILTGHPAAQYIKIMFNPQDWPGGTPRAVLDKDGLTRVRRGADGTKSQADSPGDAPNFWDMITKYCYLAEAVPYFRGRNLIIRPAVSIFDQSKPTFSPRDPVFIPTPRFDDDGNPFSSRKMIFGRNIKELTFERKFSGTKVPVVQVSAWDSSSTDRGLSKLLIEEWPSRDKEVARISGVHPSGESSQTDVARILVGGVRDREKLIGIAKALYEEIGRGELGGSCKTGSLASFKGGNDDPDLLRLRPGDAVEFLLDTRQLGSRAPGASTFVDDRRRSFDEQVAEIKKKLGGDENLARVLAASSRSSIIDLLRTFRTANVVFNWSQTGGIQVSFDFQNYVVVRHGINDQLGKNIVPPVEAAVSGSKAKRAKKRQVPEPTVRKNRNPSGAIVGPDVTDVVVEGDFYFD